MSIESVNTSQPEFVGRQEPTNKWIAISLMTSGAAIAVFGLFVVLADKGAFSTALKEAKWIQAIGAKGSVCMFGIGAGTHIIGLAILLVYQHKKNTIRDAQYDSIKRFLDIENMSEHHFNRVLARTTDAYSLKWSTETNSEESVKKIAGAIKDSLVFNGKGLKTPATPGQQVEDVTNYIVQGKPSLKLSARLLAAVFLHKDEEFLNRFRHILYGALASAENPGNDEVFEGYIGNLLSFLPFAHPEVGEELSIPVKVGDQWELSTYKVDKEFELSPSWISRMPAYGLASVDGKGPDLLLFKGTTYPADDGAIASAFADFTPGNGVGKAPFIYAKNEIRAWLAGRVGVKTIGMSLGGALAFLALERFEEVSEAQVYNAPGLYYWDFNEERPKKRVRAYIQDGDWISNLGYYPEETECFVVISGKKTLDPLSAHKAIGWCHPREMTLIRLPIERNNKKPIRHLVTGAHFVLAPPAVFIPLLAAFGIHKFVQFVVPKFKFEKSKEVEGESGDEAVADQ
jgi:hypothetical protein